MAGTPSFEWFGLVEDDTIEQGDFFFLCTVIEGVSDISAGTSVTVQASASDYDVVVVSQSCDLAHDKLASALVCPTWLLSDIAKSQSRFTNPKECEETRRGNVPGFHMLNACAVEGFVVPEVRVVSFRQVFSVPMDYLRQRAKQRPRLRLLPPYREQLAQAFARYFMRVGLPVDIPPF